jgi:hypothetical protein
MIAGCSDQRQHQPLLSDDLFTCVMTDMWLHSWFRESLEKALEIRLSLALGIGMNRLRAMISAAEKKFSSELRGWRPQTTSSSSIPGQRQGFS